MHCYDTGRRYYSRCFVLFVKERAMDAKGWRLGVTVTRKSGGAVIRNRIRRLLREVFRLHQECIPENTDLVVLPKRGLDPGQLTFHGIAAEILQILTRLAQQQAPRQIRKQS